MGLQACDPFMLALTSGAMLTCAATLSPVALPLERVPLHVKLQLFLKHQVRHLDALWTVEGGIGSILLRCLVPSVIFNAALDILFRVRAQLGVGLARLRLAEEALVHLLFGELEAVLHGLRGEPAGLRRFRSVVAGLLLLSLVLFEDSQKLELLPELLL